MQSHITVEFLKSQGLSKTTPQRFFSKIRFTNSCWIWGGFTGKKGYGYLCIGKRSKPILSHRLSWILHFGPIPHGLCVLHDCPDGDNPRCVNPAHLWIGTVAENQKDMMQKGRCADHKGEKAGKVCKLTWKSVRKIREQYFPRVVKAITLAKFYGVSLSAVHSVIYNVTWFDNSYNRNQ